MGIERINVAGVTRLPAFCHATNVADQVFVSGTLGSKPDTLELVRGGVRAETLQTLKNLAAILDACGCSLSDIAKVNVYLTDMATFGEMNEAYVSVF